MATISSLLAEHVALRVRSVDRIFLAGYLPRLQCDGQLVRFLNERAGGTIPSPAILGKIGRAYVEGINRFVKAREIPVVRFAKSDVKEDVARRHMHAAEREDRTGVVMLGVAQEKAWAWRGWRDGGHDAHPHFEFARQAVFVNHHCWYILDPEWGPAFINKHSKVKQYFKEGRALRTETTINDPYDFAINRTLTAETWQQLRTIGDDINDRLLDAQLQACSCAPDPTTLTLRVWCRRPSRTANPRPLCTSVTPE